MTNVLQGVKTKFVNRAVAAGALAVVGAAGLGAGSASAAVPAGHYNSGANDTVALTSKSAVNADNSKTRATITTSNYKQATKYIYYENVVDANFTHADYEQLQSRYSEKQLADFFRNNNQFHNQALYRKY